MIHVYHETPKVPCNEKPRREVGDCSKAAEERDPQGKQDEDAEIDESQDGMHNKNRFGVRLDKTTKFGREKQ